MVMPAQLAPPQVQVHRLAATVEDRDISVFKGTAEPMADNNNQRAILVVCDTQ